MKNKTKTYLLLVAVLGIWGIIGYKMISALSPEQPELPSQQFMADFNPKSEIENDIFTIDSVLRDPFLGTIKNKTTAYVNKLPTESPMQWPTITYGGMVKKQNTNTQIFVININAQQYLLKKGQSINDISLLRGNSKEIVVRYNNDQQTISIEQ